MHFQFPEIMTTRTVEEQAQKVVDEVREFDAEPSGDAKDKEAIDVLHAVETFIRVHFRGREDVMDDLIRKTIVKNEVRGYYAKACF